MKTLKHIFSKKWIVLAAAAFTIQHVQACTFNLSLNSSNTSAPSACDGYVYLTASGGTGPYTYTFNNSVRTLVVDSGSYYYGYEQGVCAGVYNICVTDANGCTACDSVMVGSGSNNGNCNNFSAWLAANGTTNGACNGSINILHSGGTAPYSYYLNNSQINSSLASNLCAGNYGATVVDASGCTRSLNTYLYNNNTNDSTCDARFTADDSLANNGSLTNQIYFQSSNNYQNFGAYITWNFGDGSTGTGQGITHVYATSGIYYVCSTVIDSINNCSATFCDSIYVGVANTNCDASFWASADSVQANGYNFWNNSPGVNNYNYVSWDFGDGSTGNGAQTTHQYATAGLYLVCSTVIDSINNCSATFCDSIYVGGNTGGNCDARFAVAADDSSFQTNNYVYTFASMTYNNPNAQITWSFGDGTSGYGAYLTHQYANTGTYLVCATVVDSINNCYDSFCDSVYVGAPNNNLCNANFYLYPDSITPHVWYAVNNSNGGVFSTYAWSWGDGTTSTGAYPNHTYANAGWYNICLTISDPANNCTDTFCDSVNVYKMSSSSAMIFVQVVAPNGTTSIQDAIEQASVSIYPVPATEVLNITSSNTFVKYEVVDLVGKVVNSGSLNNNTIQVSQLENGIYFVRLIDNKNQISTERFMKQ